MSGLVKHYKMNNSPQPLCFLSWFRPVSFSFLFTSLLSKIKKWIIHFMYCISMHITESTNILLHTHIVLAIIRVCFCLADCRHHLLHINIEYKNSTRNIQNVKVVCKANKCLVFKRWLVFSKILQLSQFFRSHPCLRPRELNTQHCDVYSRVKTKAWQAMFIYVFCVFAVCQVPY